MREIVHNAGAFGPQTGHSSAKASVLAMARRRVATWSARRGSRLALSQLSPALLRDIGLDRLAAEEEAQRPFWHP
jgi:uncharacterized protein YjiS (DUF1127 family)